MLPVIPLIEKVVNLNNDEFRITPYRVGQENILLQFKDSKDKKSVYGVINQILKECVLSSSIELDKLNRAQVDWLFLQIKNLSSGSGIDVKFRCKNEVEKDGKPEVCTGIFEIEFDTDNIQYTSGELQLIYKLDIAGKEFIFKLRQPTLNDELNETTDTAELIARYLESVTLGDNVTVMKDYTHSDRVEYAKTFPSIVKVEMVKGFFSKRPRISLAGEGVCSECGKNHKVQYTELLDFFI